MSNLKTIMKQSVFLILYFILTVVLGFFSNWVYTRYLTPQVFGNFALTRTIVALLPLFALFGLHKGLLRQGSFALGKENISLYNQIKDYTITVALMIGTAIGLLTFFCADLIAVYIFKKPELASQIRYFSFAIPVMVLLNMITSLYQVNKKADKGQFLYQVLYFALLLVVFYFFTYFLTEEPLVKISFLAAHVIFLLILIYHQRKLGYRFSLKIDKEEKKSIYKISFPQFLSALFNQTQKWGDTFFLGIFGTSTQVGIYYIGLRIAAFISIPANAINTIFIPVAARLIGQGKHDEVNDLYKTVSRIIFVLGSLIFGIVFFLKTYLTGFFGKAYETSAGIILIILISETIDFGVGPARQLITMSGGGRINLINSIITLTINVASSCLLIPRYGLMGAALANAFTNITLQILSVVELMVIYKLSPFNAKYFLIVGLFVFTIFGTAFLPVSEILKTVIFIAVLSAFYGTIVIDKNERNKIRNFLAQRKKKKKAPAQEYE